MCFPFHLRFSPLNQMSWRCNYCFPIRTFSSSFHPPSHLQQTGTTKKSKQFFVFFCNPLFLDFFASRHRKEKETLTFWRGFFIKLLFHFSTSKSFTHFGALVLLFSSQDAQNGVKPFHKSIFKVQISAELFELVYKKKRKRNRIKLLIINYYL